MNNFCMRTMGVYEKLNTVLTQNSRIHIHTDKKVRVFVKENEFIWQEDNGNRLSDCKMMNLLHESKFLKHRIEVFP